MAFTPSYPFYKFRPTYIYGPGNYNPIERWFFDRITYNRPIPIPGNGEIITQLGHVVDLTNAIVLSLYSEKAENQIYNCSGKQGLTFKGIIEYAAIACDKNPSDIQVISFDPSSIDKKARKLFPLRLEHFFTDISKLERDLKWSPSFNIKEGLIDSFKHDYILSRTNPPDFSCDNILTQKLNN